MWNQDATLTILPCTVSQLRSASRVSSGNFAICDWELKQVSVVGIIREFSSFETNFQYFVDDMTSAPLNVRQWVNDAEGRALMTSASPGTYVKVTGTTRNFNGQRSLLATNVRCIKDLNEITSHMLEVVRTHMQLFRKVLDVNMNTTLASVPGKHDGGRHDGILTSGLSAVHHLVLHVIRKSSHRFAGIGFSELKTQLDHVSMRDLRSSLAFLLNQGHVFSTIDEHHFKSTEH